MRSLTLQAVLSLLLVALLAAPPGLLAANHREAPITAIDRLADITDFYAFVSYDDASKVTFILDVDPFLEPSNGPTYFPFDPEILYAIKVDNNHDGIEDVTFEFRFQSEIRQPDLFTVYAGAGNGIPATGDQIDRFVPERAFEDRTPAPHVVARRLRLGRDEFIPRPCIAVGRGVDADRNVFHRGVCQH